MKKLQLLALILLALTTFSNPCVADSKISELQDGGTIQTTDQIPVGRAGCTHGGNCRVVVGSMATQGAGAVAITGGLIDGVSIGSSTPGTGAFTTLSATGITTIANGSSGVPALTFAGDTTTGLRWGSSHNLYVINGGTESFYFGSGGHLKANNSSGGDFIDAASSATQVIFAPNQSDEHAGVLADAAGDVSLAADSSGSTQEILRVKNTGVYVVSGVMAVGTTSANAGVSLDLGSETDSLLLPTGTTGQRPTGINGMVRYNSTTNAIEGYVNNAWAALSTGGSMVYPGAGIANSTGSAWGTSYTTSGSGTVLALAASPSFTTPTLGAASGTSLALSGNLTISAGSASIGTTSPAASLDLSHETDALALPSGTTGQRPTGINGMLRYNSTTPGLEAYVNNAWSAISTGSGSSGCLGYKAFITSGSTWTAPSCTTSSTTFKVTIVAAGAFSGTSTGGGGAGQTAIKWVTGLSSGGSYSISVGAGSTFNTAGGNTTFNDGTTTYTAHGGGYTSNTSGAAGGSGTTNADVSFTGGYGANGSAGMGGSSIFGNYPVCGSGGWDGNNGSNGCIYIEGVSP